jgi:hypothetical protein
LTIGAFFKGGQVMVLYSLVPSKNPNPEKKGERSKGGTRINGILKSGLGLPPPED